MGAGGGEPEPVEAPPLRFQRPQLPRTTEIDGYLALARTERWFSNGGPCWRLLRARLAERAGASCVPVSSGTTGLMAAIAALRERTPTRRSEVLLPSFTFPATLQSALWCGLRPRFLDIDADNWHLDPGQLEEELDRSRDNVALVIAVSAFGTPAPAETRDRWERACAAAGVPLLVDSAAGYGAVADDGRAVGAQGTVEVVSFHATKPLAIGEGGAVFARDRSLIERIERTVNFGFGDERLIVSPLGINGKMSELHAATGLAALDHHDEVLAARRRMAGKIMRLGGAGVQWQGGYERSTWQFVPVAFGDGRARQERLREHSATVELRTYYEPLHLMPPFAGVPVALSGLERTEDLASRILSLPMANDLTPAELGSIAEVIAGTRA